MKPIVILNFKTYPEILGDKEIKAAKITNKFKNKADIIIAAQFTNIKDISKLGIKTIGQHVDYYEPGRNTGYVTIESLKKAGAVGSLLNHSEHKISLRDFNKTVKRAKRLNFKIIGLAKDINEAKKLIKIKPYAVALEDPRLISKYSISKKEPELLIKFVKELKNKNVKLLCGAGISNNYDFKTALKIGLDGVLFSSAFTKAKNKERLLKSFF